MAWRQCHPIKAKRPARQRYCLDTFLAVSGHLVDRFYVAQNAVIRISTYTTTQVSDPENVTLTLSCCYCVGKMIEPREKEACFFCKMSCFDFGQDAI